MLTPFQRLLYCSRQGSRRLNVLLAASGPTIRLFNALDGMFISKWSHLEPTETKQAARDRSPGSHDDKGSEGPPGKRRKLSNDSAPSEASSVEVVVDNGGKKRRKSKRKDFLIPSVTSLTVTSDGKHVIAVTGEDKSLRVLELLDNGVLKQISQRIMPKRPSVVALTNDQQIILCADKFGDVYAMPLLWRPVDDSNEATGAPDPILVYTSFRAPSKHGASKPSAPSASTSTVHSQNNLRALAHQQRIYTNQDSTSVKATPSKQTLNFPYQLLLGHVSLLTDLITVTLSSPENFQGTRSYILTSDRDEHIRVSRGMPQAHIIENFCLGHKQFVNRIHVPAWRPEVLISGGGDDFLMVWDWLKGETIQEVDLKAHVDKVRMDTLGQKGKGKAKEDEEGTKGMEEVEGLEGQKAAAVAVSGIWSMQTGNVEKTGEVIVTCEAVPALFLFKFLADGTLSYRFALATEGNVLSVTVHAEALQLLYTVDNIHAPVTTNVVVTDEGEWAGRRYIGSYKIVPESEDEWIKEEGEALEAINAYAVKEEDALTANMDAAAMEDLLYGIEHLRKRGVDEGNEGNERNEGDRGD